MCGRYTLFSDFNTIDTLIGSSQPNETEGIFKKKCLQETGHTLPSYNIAPSHVVPVILTINTSTNQLIRILFSRYIFFQYLLKKLIQTVVFYVVHQKIG